MQGSINSIESMGLLDGPGIRTVFFLNGCKLRCLYCHNPEMFMMSEMNITSDEVVQMAKRYKTYYKNNGGVTFSGGEPLLQYEFLLETVKKLKLEGIHVAVDTAGYGNGNYDELLPLVDLFLLDIKEVTDEGYKKLTGQGINGLYKFIELLNFYQKKVWIRQVIVPGIMDNDLYLENLAYIVKKINNVERVDFLPYHKMGLEKYEKLGIEYQLNSDDMDKEKCDLLYKKFIKMI